MKRPHHTNTLYYHTGNTDFGPVTIVTDKDAITRIAFGIPADLSGTDKEIPLIQEAFCQLNEYFAGKRKIFSLPLSPCGTDFQKRVWAALCRIPYGATATYGQIAANIQNPKACRAVGMANNKNPIAIVIPCHRIIGHKGDLVGYGAGLEFKKKLLQLESSF